MIVVHGSCSFFFFSAAIVGLQATILLCSSLSAVIGALGCSVAVIMWLRGVFVNRELEKNERM
jgi:hypothetical protein